MSSKDGSSRGSAENSEEDLQSVQKNGSPKFESKKRQNYITWEDYFMGIAYLAAQRSKDPRTQVGSCIVSDDNKIVGVGYNGMPRGCEDDDFPWIKNKNSFLNDKLTYVCHAEMNAFMNANPKDTRGCKLYVTLFPCNECAKIIIQAGIREVIYSVEKTNDKTIAAKIMFDAVKIKYSLFEPRRSKIIIDFYRPTAESGSWTPSPPKKGRRDEENTQPGKST